MLPNFLKTMNTLLGGLLVASVGAFAGSVLLSAIVIGWHYICVNLLGNPFGEYSTQDGQWESFTLMGTIPYGADLGIILAGIMTTRHYFLRDDETTAALISLSAGIMPMICTGALFVYTVIQMENISQKIYLIHLSIPLVASTYLVIWGVSGLIYIHKTRT